MTIRRNGKTLVLTGGILLLILLIISFLLWRMGGIYKSELSRFSDEPSSEPVTHIEKAQIRKITFQKKGEGGCTEVTPEGIVRIYATCGKELVDARRVADTKYILRLYKQVSEMRTDTFKTVSNTPCDGYLLTIDMDAGPAAACLSTGSGNGSSGGGVTADGGSGSGNNGGNGGSSQGVEDIVKTIDLILDDILPTPTPTNVPAVATPTVTHGVTSTPSPTTGMPQWGNTPTPSPIPQWPFTCDYIDAQGKRRPYTVSNIICSTEPSPAP